MLPVDSVAMPDSDWHRLQGIIAGFETSWKRGQRPRIVDYLPFDEPRREALLVELVHAELEFRLKAGEPARVEEYLRDYPQLGRDRSTVLGLIKGEWSFRRRREANLSLEGFRERFPGFREELEGSRSDAPLIFAARNSSQVGSKGPAIPEPPLPRRLGKFELREKLGAGSFGVVYRAWDTLLKREVAVKVPRPGVILAGPDLRAFLREARNAIHLRHPHIVAIFDASPVEDTVCLVRAYIDGPTLAERLRESAFSPRESAALMACVADALDHAHRQGIIHRDLKPSNILLDRQGRPHVADFGLAKHDSGESTLSPAGSPGALIGTPAYMSPEQARGEASQVDARSDVFGAGVVLYELLTGSLPFRGRGRMLQSQIQGLDPSPPRSLNEDVPPDLESICLKALAKKPADRYQAASELADDLKKFLQGGPVAPKLGLPLEPRARLLRAPAWVVASFAITLSIGLVGLTFLWLQAEARRQRDRDGLARTYRAMLDLARPPESSGVDGSQRPGPLRERIWDELAELAPALEGDPSLWGLATDAYLGLADRARARGSDRQAGPRWARAIALCEALVRDHPDDLARRDDLARALGHLAGLRARAGASEEARRLQDRSIALRVEVRSGRRRLASGRSGDARALLDLAETQVRLIEAGDLVGEGTDLAEAERIASELEGRASLEPPDRRRLARLLLDISRSELAARRSFRALNFARMGHRLFREMASHPDVEAGLAQASLAAARANRDFGRESDARKEFESASERFEALARSDPLEPEFPRQQGAALFELGRLLDQLGRRDEATLAYRKSLRVRRESHRANPESPSDLADLGQARAALASALEAEGRNRLAAGITLLAILDEARAVALAPGVKSYRQELAGLAGSLARRVRQDTELRPFLWIYRRLRVGPTSVGPGIFRDEG